MAPDDDYLWDKRGTPDPEVEQLERTLGSLAHQGRPLVLPEPPPTPAKPARPAWTDIWRRREPALALAAGLLVVAATAIEWQAARLRGWQVTSLEGAPRAANRVLRAKDRLSPGQWLTTDASSRAQLKVGDIGLVEIWPHSRVRLVTARRDRQQLAIQVGGMRAIIVAPPGRFQVETPSALAVDLGCAYFLEVAADGGSQLTVEIGWVSFETGGRESFVPAGARCITRPGFAPGTPAFTDAPADVKNGLAMFDFGVAATPDAPQDSVARRNAGLAMVLSSARNEDALTLWHLLSRTNGDERGQVFDALAARVPPPAGITRQGILEGDPTMLEHWWDALGFGDTATWRRWRRPWGELASR